MGMLWLGACTFRSCSIAAEGQTLACRAFTTSASLTLLRPLLRDIMGTQAAPGLEAA